MVSLDSLLDSPPGVSVALTQPVSAPPSDRRLDELFDSPLLALPASRECGADQCEVEPVEVHRGRSSVSKKLFLDGAAAREASQPGDLPLELVCLILTFLFVDDVGNHNAGIGAVSRTWRDATELLAEAWARAPHAIPVLASPFVVMWAAGRIMRDVVVGTWGCTYWCGTVFPRHQIGTLLSPVGWLFDDTIVLFYRYVLCVPTLLIAIRSAKEAELNGWLDKWVCPQAVLIEPCWMESFREPRRRDEAADLFCKHPDFSDVLALVLCTASTVYAPICVGHSHWILVVVWLRTGVVEVYDSMGGSRLRSIRLVIEFLDLVCRKHEHDTIINMLGIHGWHIIQHGTTSPQQTDGDSCGVFVCITGICISRCRPVAFSQREVMYWRLHIAFLLITNWAAVITDTPPTHQRRTVPVREDPDGALVILSDSEA
jgi:hypothetical protein